MGTATQSATSGNAARARKGKRGEIRSTLALKIVRAAVDPEVSVHALATMAERDTAFAMRMLGVVNSAAYGLPAPMTDIKQAAAMLGVNGMRNIALSLSLCEMVPVGPEGAGLLAASLRRGIAARLIAVALGERKRAEEYFTAGLLLEAGILAHAADDFRTAVSIAQAPAVTRPVKERLAGLSPHNERGAELAEGWNLGEGVVAAIRGHHDEEPPEPKIAKAAWLAERVAATFEGGDVQALRRAALDGGASMGIKPPAINGMLTVLPKLVVNAARGFDRDVGDQQSIEELVGDAAAQLVEMNQRFQEMIRALERMLREKEELTEKLEKANTQLQQMASLDGLTGLPNHRTFQDALTRDLARAARSGESLSLVMIDVDHFKSFNDNYGHPAGDAVLRALSKLLRASTRDGDLPARYGGEEFVLVLPDTNGEDAFLVADRLRENLAKMRVTLKGEKVQVTASFGLATTQGKNCSGDASALIAAADSGLYEAKDAGRNCVKRVDFPTN